MKRLIYMLFVLLMLSTVAAQTLPCDSPVPPRRDCTVTTPVINCSNYDLVYIPNGTRIITAGTMSELTPNTGVYNFTFNQPPGEYKVILCENSTLAINVKHAGVDRMLSIIIGSITIIAFFLLIGLISKSHPVKFFSLALATIQLIYMIFMLYVNEVGQPLDNLLKINFIIFGILGFGIGMISLTMFIFENVTMEEEQKHGAYDFGGKWASKKW